MKKLCRQEGDKVKFRTHESALMRAAELVKRYNAPQMTAYKCRHGNHWHLTSTKPISDMSRTEKLSKLANAVRDYRGATNNAQWQRPPKHAEIERVKRWLRRLDLDVDACLTRINNFTTCDEFDRWMKSLSEIQLTSHPLP